VLLDCHMRSGRRVVAQADMGFALDRRRAESAPNIVV
jgi:hypothetical protein